MTAPAMTPDQARFYGGYVVPGGGLTVVKVASPGALTPAPLAKPLPDTPDPGHVTSAVARDALGLAQISKQAAEVLEVVRIAHRAGVADLSGREFRAWWQKVHVGGDIDTSTIAARFNELISAKRLERLPNRLCSVSKKSVGPVRIVAQQTRLGV